MKNNLSSNIIIGLDKAITAKIVFVDFMDTIVKRNCTLRHLLKRWSRKLGNEFDIYPAYLYNYRLNVLSGKMHNRVKADFIYQEIADQCICHNLLDAKRKIKFCQRAHDIEMECELKTHKLNKKIADFIRKQKGNGAQLYLLSDFRLPSGDIKLFLERFNILYLFNDVFSSCEFGMTKKDGSLYPAVIDKIKANSNDIIMIGDNLNSDCINASNYGVRSVWLRKTMIQSIMYRICQCI